MLTVLRVKNYNKAEKFKRRRICKPKICKCVTEKIAYNEIICYVGKKGIPWKKVAVFLSKTGGSLLVPEKTEVPQKYGISLCKFNEGEQLICRLLHSVLSTMDNKGKIRLGICAAKAENAQDALDMLVPLAGEVYLCCDNYKNINNICERVMENTGAAIIICDNTQFLCRCNAVYIQNNFAQTVNFNNALCFGGTCGGLNINSAEYTIPPELRELYDGSFNRNLFVSAFYNEYAGALGKLPPLAGVSGNRQYTVRQMCEYLLHNMNNPTAV